MFIFVVHTLCVESEAKEMNLDFWDSLQFGADTFSTSESRMKVLLALVDYVDTHGHTPTVREIANMLGHRSHSAVHLHLEALRRQGYLKGRSRRARSWYLTSKGRRAAA